MVESTPSRASYVLIALLGLGLCLAAVVALGSQTSRILSTVGNSIGGYDTGAAAPPDNPAPASTDTPAAGGQPELAAAAVPALLIVRTGTLDLEVADLGASIAATDSTVSRAGGYVSASTRAATADDSTAQTTYRIPSAAWETTLAALRAVARDVKAEAIKTEEVSGQVVDLTARISNLRATEAALQAIMAKAIKISDVLDVQGQLTTTRGEIERLVAEKAALTDRASFGSLSVTFRLPVPPKPAVTATPTNGWDPGADVANATGKLVRIGQRATSAGIWLGIIGLPLLISGALLLLVAWQMVRLGRWMIGRRRDPEAAGGPAA
jgi:Domain of unknown function (DUF4349)